LAKIDRIKLEVECPNSNQKEMQLKHWNKPSHQPVDRRVSLIWFDCTWICIELSRCL